ncbi:MAG: hypothetical protein H6624_02690 [Bdellovibrionaceae bacterium]|nr:hypothetical protein [Bdellovibrionales bacterium]MCB9083219.1 hypothetical protein [Pseudobdellovibrionaceae bacterium]
MRWNCIIARSSVLVFLSVLVLNCSDVRLMEKLEQDRRVSSFVYGKETLCLPEDQTLVSFQVSNLNAVVYKGHLEHDSDGDGLPDIEEAKLGFDPLNYRSQGVLSDRLCLNSTGQSDCGAMDIQCDGRENALGISECDLKAARLDELYDHPDQGLDSDKDGVIDLVEIRAGGFPGIDDEGNDLDGDGVINREEYQQGTEIRRFDQDLPEKHRTLVEVNKLADGAKGCAGQSWLINLKQVPLVVTEEYIDPQDNTREGIERSHRQKGNIILMVFKTRPILGNGNAKVWYRSVEAVHSVEAMFQPIGLRQGDFQLAGEVEP